MQVWGRVEFQHLLSPFCSSSTYRVIYFTLQPLRLYQKRWLLLFYFFFSFLTQSYANNSVYIIWTSNDFLSSERDRVSSCCHGAARCCICVLLDLWPRNISFEIFPATCQTTPPLCKNDAFGIVVPCSSGCQLLRVASSFVFIIQWSLELWGRLPS